MPRPRNDSLLVLFKSNDLNQIVCYNEGCDGKVLYKHSANLERHLKLLHPSIYAMYLKKKKTFKFPGKPNLEKRLIDLVIGHPILWNKFHEDRFNEDLTNKAWIEISCKMDVTVHMCKKKWDSLIDRFRSELNKFSQPICESDIDTNCKSKSSWKFFPDLIFLRDKIDLTKNVVNILPKQMENFIQIDNIKEESSESFSLCDEALGDSSPFEFGEELILETEKYESRLMDEILKSSTQDDNKSSSGPQNDKDVSGPPDDSEVTKRQYDNQISKKLSNGRPSLYDTDSEDDSIAEKVNKTRRKKVKLMSENDSSVISDFDADRMFLLSLLPFLKSVPSGRKLFVRHRIQGVLLEEQQNS